MRQIVLDTETTGLNPKEGHRIIEIGCVELLDRKLTGNQFHCYLNPEREMDAEAERIHGLSTAFLADKPLFSEEAEAFMAFIEGAELLIHNAPFDVGFINHELALLKFPIIDINQCCQIVDTLKMAREKHPGQKNNLDALCRRYHVNNAHRDLHGALLDSEILADVYLAMTGGQLSLAFDRDFGREEHESANGLENIAWVKPELAVVRATQQELEQHSKYLAHLQKKSGAHFWSD